MKLLVYLFAFTAALLVPIGPSVGQSYPSKPIRIVVPAAPGGGTDVLARLLGQWMSDRIGQPVIIENRPGAGGNIGTEAVAKAAPDGHTLLLVNVANAVNVTLYSNLSFNFVRDIAPVGGIGREPFVIIVHPAFPARNLSGMLKYATANPGKINMASAGHGTGGHVSGELLNIMAKIQMVHVPYRGAALALNDIIAGHVQLTFASLTASNEFIVSGKLVALAVTGAKRSELQPDIPTLGEVLPGYESSFWTGIGAPKGTPHTVIELLNALINKWLNEPTTMSRLAETGAVVMGGTPDEFGKLIAAETEKWAKVVTFAKLKPN